MLLIQEGKIMYIDPCEDFYDKLVNVLLNEVDKEDDGE